MDSPDRLFPTAVHISAVAELDREADGLGEATPTVCQIVIDLEQVIAVSERPDYSTYTPHPDQATVELRSGDNWVVLTPYAEVLAAWVAYRRHADRDPLARIRN